MPWRSKRAALAICRLLLGMMIWASPGSWFLFRVRADSPYSAFSATLADLAARLAGAVTFRWRRVIVAGGGVPLISMAFHQCRDTKSHGEILIRRRHAAPMPYRAKPSHGRRCRRPACAVVASDGNRRRR